MARKLVKGVLAVGTQLQADDAPVEFVTMAGDEAVADGAVDEFDHRMVAQHEAVSSFADGQALSATTGLDGEQKLVLLGVDAGLAGRMVAE